MIRSVIALAVLAAVSVASGGLARAQGCLDQLPPDQKSRLEQQRISLNLRDASIPTTMRLLAQQYKLNMLITDDVTGNITLDFFQVPARDVFQAIIDAARLDCIVVGNALRVSTSKRLKTEQDERAKTEAELRKVLADERRIEQEVEARRADAEIRRAEAEARRAEAEARGPIREEMIRLRYADAEEVAKTIQGILGLKAAGQFSAPVPLPQLSQLYSPSPPTEIPSTPTPPLTAPGPETGLSPEAISKGLTVGAYKRTNSVFIRYYARDLERIKALITERLDIPVAQIQIAAQMVITTLTALEQIGVQWGAGKATAVGKNTVVVGQGFAAPVNPAGTPTPFPGATAPPPADAASLISPATIGSLVNLPTSLLGVAAPPAGGVLLGLLGSNFNINLAIQALEVQSKARSLAEPKVITVENAKAIISRGFEVPFTSTPTQGVQQVQFKEALLKLEVTPRLIRDNGDLKIRMSIILDNDAPDFTQRVGDNPSIFKRRQETDVIINQGQRVVIGGVTSDTSSTTIRKVPLLGDIPVLGWLFKSREVNSSNPGREELIVILTPSVISEPAAALKR